jgi:hypothetical protein
VTYYVINRSRASPVVLRFFKKAFAGVLVSDFWGAYNAIVCAQKQKCLAHLLNELKKVAKYKDTSKDWKEFSKRLKRLLRDALRLRGPCGACDSWCGGDAEEQLLQSERGGSENAGYIDECISDIEAARLSGNGHCH